MKHGMSEPIAPVPEAPSSWMPAPSQAVGAMASWLMGQTPNLQPGPSERAADVRRVVGLLRAFPECAAAQWVADGFDSWLTRGGDLQQTMGLRPQRGRAQDLPHRFERRKARDKALCALAATLIEPDRAGALAAMVVADHPAVVVIRQEAGDVPTSRAQIARILRSAGQP